MGSSQSFSSIHTSDAHKLVIGGLDGAGKTTILYGIKWNEVISSIHTIGHNKQLLTFKGELLEYWDLGGCSKIRLMYKHHFLGMKGLMYVIDLSDHERLDQTLEEFGTSISLTLI